MKANARGTPAKFDGHAGEGDQEGSNAARQPSQGHGVGQEEPEQPASHRGDQAHLDGEQVGLEDRGSEKMGNICQAEASPRVLEALHQERPRGQNHERAGKQEERNQADPHPRRDANGGARRARTPSNRR